jgi:hypothetical protein
LRKGFTQFLHPQRVFINLGLFVMATSSPPIDLSDRMLVTLAAYGLFMINWSLLETVLEVAIAKRVDLHPLEGTIITCGLNFQSRASILRSFLALDQTQDSKDAIALINTITQEASRNAIIHGQVFVHGETLMFVHRRTDQSLIAKTVSLDSDAMSEKGTRLKESIIKLQSLLSVSEEDLHEFGNISLILANRSATSPKPR